VSSTSLLLAAWANSGLLNRAKQAHDILRKAEDESSASLTNVAYNTVLHTYASSVKLDRENAKRADNLVKHMRSRGIECDVSTYSSLLFAHSNAGDPDRAMELLTQMEEEADATHPFPNTICYNTGKKLCRFCTACIFWRRLSHSSCASSWTI